MRFLMLFLAFFSTIAFAGDPVVTCDITGDQEQAKRFCTLFESGLPDNCQARLVGELAVSSRGSVTFKDRVLVVRINGQVCSLEGTTGWSLLTNRLYADFQYANWAGQECGKLYCGGAAAPPSPTQEEIDAASKGCVIEMAEGVDARFSEAICADLDSQFRRVIAACSYGVQMRLEVGRYGTPYASSMKVTVAGNACDIDMMSVQSFMNPFGADLDAVGAIGRQCAELCRLPSK